MRISPRLPQFARSFIFGNSAIDEVRASDFIFVVGLRLLALILILIFALIVIFLTLRSKPILQQEGLSFFFNKEWDANADHYGALAFMYGTLVTSTIALLFSVPIALGASLFITELAPPWLARPVGFLIELLAAIPSVVYGLWGIFVLAPFIRDFVQPALTNTLGALPLFQGPPFGIGLLSAGLILAIMILPTITAVCREVFAAVPVNLREGALTLGATRWETILWAVLKTGLPGILSAVILGLGRALGETMAVTMLIGNRAIISSSLFSPGATMTSVIANEYPEASSDLHLSALTAVGLALFIVSLVVNGIARWIIASSRKRGSM